MDRRTLLRSALLLATATPAIADDKAETAVDPAPLHNELAKYPRCSQCNMDRRMFHRTRHLIHYLDGSAEGSCSIRCVAVSLMQKVEMGAKAIYAADFGSEAEPRPLVDADKATYIVGGAFPPLMSKRPKTAFADPAVAKAAREAKGGELANFDQALTAAYADLVDDMKTRRQSRAEREERKRRAAAG
jgi:copper chaperone NosL